MARSERARKIGRLHQLKAQAGLDDETYRDRLALITGGKRSASDCTDAELDALIASFHVKQKTNNSYTAKIRALWIACWNLGLLADGSDRALDAFVTRQTGSASLTFVGATEAGAIAEALKAMLARAGCDVPAGDAGGMASRRALIRAQWAKLEALGKAKVAGEFGLSGFCNAVAKGAHRLSLDHFTAAELDKASRALGAMIRKAR